jgi:PAS domain S-box-containing protein
MMANLVPLIIWTTDANGDWNFLNVRWQQVTGMKTEAGLAKGWRTLIHPNDRDNISQSWMRAFADRKPFEAKFRFLRASGEFNATYANSTPRFHASGEFAGYIGILQDVSADERIKSSLEKIVVERTDDLRKRNAELRMAEKQLLEKNEELEEINNRLSSFAHIASHDLQEPLRKIQTLSNLLFQLEGEKFSDKGKEMFSRISHTSGRMRSLIRDLLAFSQSEETDHTFEEVDLNLLLQDVIGELEVQINDKGATVEDRGLPTANVIRFQFHQLFMNLLSNAIKFSNTDVPPRIIIESAIVGPGASVNGLGQLDVAHHHIRISDNGIGFEPDHARKIFEMFHRLHGRKQYEGTGIGLAICKKILENHKGLISAEGRPGKGAKFDIYFPVEGLNT